MAGSYRRDTSDMELVQARPDLEEKVLSLREAHPRVTDRQAELIDQMLATGDSTRAAAIAIGADESWAYKVMKEPHVLSYAHDLGKCVMGSHALNAIHRLHSLLNARSQYVQLEAARDILDRTGMRADNGSSGRAASIEITLDLGGPTRAVTKGGGV